MIKVAFVVTNEVYRMLQATAARHEQALPVYLRAAVFRDAQIAASAIEAQPAVGMPKLTRTKRDLLTLLQKHATINKGAPYLTTGQIGAALQQSDQAVYLNLRYLLRDGLIERGENLQRQGQPGAPFKTYSITELGARSLSDDQHRMTRAYDDLQERTQAAYSDLGQGNERPKPTTPQVDPSRVHNALRYIAMAQLGRAIESEADVDAMKATHARLCAAADSDVAAGAHTYDQILEKLTAKIESLGGQAAISASFNGA